MRLRPCIECGRPTDGSRCAQHQLARPYDHEHRALRAEWAKRLARSGGIPCRRADYDQCVADDPIIRPGDAWDLGHPDAMVPTATAPEHEACNRGANNRRFD